MLCSVRHPMHCYNALQSQQDYKRDLVYFLKKLFLDSKNDVVFNNGPVGKSLEKARIQYFMCANMV